MRTLTYLLKAKLQAVTHWWRQWYGLTRKQGWCLAWHVWFLFSFHVVLRNINTYDVETHGWMVKASDSWSRGRGFDSHRWLCVEVLGKLLTPHCLWPPSSDEYLVQKMLGKQRWDCRLNMYIEIINDTFTFMIRKWRYRNNVMHKYIGRNNTITTIPSITVAFVILSIL